MRFILLATLAIALSANAVAADAIQVDAKQLSPDRFELTAKLAAGVDPSQAQSLLMPVAEQLCGGRAPQLGHYRFESQAPLAQDKKDQGTQTFTQQVACGAASVAHATLPSAPKAPPSAEDERVVRDNTLAYLEAKDSGNFDKAYTMLSEGTATMMRADNWRKPRAAFNDAAGMPSRREVVRLTWYDDPTGAPPGRYAAADYRGDYHHAGFYCGFVMAPAAGWHV